MTQRVREEKDERSEFNKIMSVHSIFFELTLVDYSITSIAGIFHGYQLSWNDCSI